MYTRLGKRYLRWALTDKQYRYLMLAREAHKTLDLQHIRAIEELLGTGYTSLNKSKIWDLVGGYPDYSWWCEFMLPDGYLRHDAY